MAPILRRPGPMYVSVWYFMAAFVWTILTYAMGNFLPQYFVPGTGGGAIAGLFIHDLVGLFVTPLGWGLMYFFVPIILQKPVWSHALSLVGFWGLAFFYPLTGIHHFLYTPIPMFLQYGAVVSTIAVEMVVVTVIVNFIGTIWGSGGMALSNLTLRWFFTGIIFYGLTCFQCALQATLTFQALIHFTDWVVGHAHMVMFGVFGFWLLGIMTHLIPRIWRTPWYSTRLAELHYWLSASGLLVMVSGLILVGVFQGSSWAALQPWEDSLAVSKPYWYLRLVTGLVVIAGQVCFAINLVQTYRVARKSAVHAAQVGG
jgi:cytochrome c oxidase cbb3-type subunit 1